MTGRLIRSCLGSSRVRAASTARSAQSSLGLGCWRRAYLLAHQAGWLRESGRLDDGAKALEDLARELDRLPRSGHDLEWCRLRMEQGVAAHHRGDFKAAEAFLAEAETIATQSQAHDLLLTDVLANQAALYLDQGRLGDAKNALLRTLEIDRRTGNKYGESNDLNMLGMVYESLGDTETSRLYLTRAFELADQSGLTREAADAKTNLAALMDNVGDHQGAAEMFRQIGQIRAEGGDESGVACSVANQGVAASQAGDIDNAVALLTHAHELHLAAGNQLHGAQDLLNLSSAESRRGRTDQALRYARRALAAAREFGLIELLWAAEASVSGLLEDQATGSTGDPGAIQAIEEALAGYRRAADIVELLRSGIDRPEERESILAGKEAIYDHAIFLCGYLHRVGEAFQFSERARMRSFLEALGSSRLERIEAGDQAAARRGELVARLLSPHTPASEKPGLMDDLRILRAETMARRPALAAITEAELPTEDDIRAAIPPDTCVLEYYEYGTSVALFLLDRDGLKDCHLVQLGQPLDALVGRFGDEIESGDEELAAGNTLFGILIRPVMPMLATTVNLIVVPHRSIHYVPFSALWFEPTGDDAPPRQYLKNRFCLTTIPSASYLPFLARTAKSVHEHGPPVVLGNPTGDLAGADLEARQVAGLLGVTAQLREKATRDALLCAGAPVVLHVAGHGAYNDTDPLLSGLALANGVVTVEDLLGSGPAPGLLVLSACVTGKSKRRPGDELIGLAQAALRCGTRSVVATLWETSDDSSPVFFGHFYGALAEGNTVSEAVAWARQALATSPGGYDHPVEWAPFLVIGDPEHRLGEPGRGPMAEWQHGADLAEQGDVAGAKAAFQKLIGSRSPMAAAAAAWSLGALFYDEGDLERALAAWQQGADSGDPLSAPLAAHGLGKLLEDRGDVDGARAAFQRAIDSGQDEAAPQAANDLGILLVRQGDPLAARAAFQRAIDSGHRDAAPQAAINLGNLLVRQGLPRAAQAAFQRAIDSGHPEEMPWAAYCLGEMLAAREDPDGALKAFRLAAKSKNADAARRAAARIADL